MTRARARLPLAVLVVAAAATLIALAARPGPRLAMPGPPARPPGLADLWSGRATPVLARKLASAAYGTPPASGAFSGAHVEIVGGTWYLFNRWVEARPCGAAGLPLTGTQVRASTDRGATWGTPYRVLTPTPGTAWSCAAADGDAVYDAAARTWRFLFQCMGADGTWNGCYAERHDPSPLGPFVAPRPDPNPVIRSGALWRRICDPGDACGGRSMHDEGTFDVFGRAAGGDWWVSFHGTDGAAGFRGVARTPDFRTWRTDGAAGTPRDAIIGPADARTWRESWQPGGPIGAGAAATLREGGWYYTLAEVPDRSLNCTPGQTWDLGLFRARTPAGPLEQYPAGNPLVYSTRAPDATGAAPACSVEYPGLFRDPATGRTYLSYGRIPSGDTAYDALYLYRLEWNRNLLADGGFSRPDAGDWAGLAVQRAPDGSPDGTQYATVAGGVTASATAAVPPGAAGGTVAFGGTLRTEAGAGAVDVVLRQLDDQGRAFASAAVHLGATTTWARARQLLTLDGRTRRVRYEVHPAPGVTVRADNLYVIPQDGCAAPRYPAC